MYQKRAHFARRQEQRTKQRFQWKFTTLSSPAMSIAVLDGAVFVTASSVALPEADTAAVDTGLVAGAAEAAAAALEASTVTTTDARSFVLDSLGFAAAAPAAGLRF